MHTSKKEYSLITASLVQWKSMSHNLEGHNAIIAKGLNTLQANVELLTPHVANAMINMESNHALSPTSSVSHAKKATQPEIRDVYREHKRKVTSQTLIRAHHFIILNVKNSN